MWSKANSKQPNPNRQLESGEQGQILPHPLLRGSLHGYKVWNFHWIGLEYRSIPANGIFAERANLHCRVFSSRTLSHHRVLNSFEMDAQPKLALQGGSEMQTHGECISKIFRRGFPGPHQVDGALLNRRRGVPLRSESPAKSFKYRVFNLFRVPLLKQGAWLNGGPRAMTSGQMMLSKRRPMFVSFSSL